MVRAFLVTFLVALSLAASCKNRVDDGAQPTLEAPQRGATNGVEWISFVTGGARSSDALPMIVGMHGRTGKPEKFGRALTSLSVRARVVLLRGGLTAGDGFAWFSGNKGGLDGEDATKGIVLAADRVADVVRALTKEVPTIGRPIVTGFSQGAAVAYAIAAMHPDVASHIFPVAGWLPPGVDVASSASRPRVLGFHGDADEIVPLFEGKRAVDRLAAAGYPAELRVISGARHAVEPAQRALVEALDAAAKEAE